MKTRQEIKTHSKLQFSNNYWISVGATILGLLIIGAAGSVSFGIGTLFLAPPDFSWIELLFTVYLPK